MSVPRIDFEEKIWRGDTTEIPVEMFSGTVELPIDGAKIVFTLKLDPYTTDELASFKYEADIPEGDPEGLLGRHVIRIEQGQTNHMPLIPHIYQIKVIWPDSPHPTEMTYVWGTVELGDS